MNRFWLRLLVFSMVLVFNGCPAFPSFLNSLAIKPTTAFASCGEMLFCFVGGFICLTLSFAFAHLAFLPVSRLHTLRSAIVHYFMNISLYFIGGLLWHRADRSTKNVRASQMHRLATLLSQNEETEFGRKMKFSTIKNYADFKAKIPLSTYDSYQEYVERIAERGEQNLLTSDNVIHFGVSSGTTTGKCKLLPAGKQVIWDFLSGLVLPLHYRQKAKYLWRLSPLAPLKSFDMLYSPKWRYASCGLPIGPMSSSIAKESLFTTVGRTTPAGCQTYMKETAQLYIHWLFALFDDEVAGFNGSFAGCALVGMEFLRNNWKKLTDDIRHGKLTYEEIPDHVARLVNLPPNPRRADELVAQFSRGFEGIVHRLWPRINFCWCISTGTHAVYVERLKWFLGIPILSPLYACSETIFGVPMNSEQDEAMRYTLLPGFAFMEFIPESEIAFETPSTVLMHQLEIGKRYEIVTSSSIGFYRYRIGDIVKVVDFYNESPVVEFCSRAGAILDLRGEKTYEDLVYSALQQAVEKWPEARRLVDFTASEGESLAKANSIFRESYLHYVLFVEIDGLNRALRRDEIALFDDALMAYSYPYKSFRGKDGLGFPKIFVVKSGTFEAMKREILRQNETVSTQYKTPRYLTNSERLCFLADRIFPLSADEAE